MGRVKKKNKTLVNFITTAILFILFILLLIAVLKFDVQAIGPEQSTIGLATINKLVFDYFSVNMLWYHITDWIGVVAIGVAFGFAILGMVQLIKRKSFKKVDYRILLVGAIYLLTIVCYIIFEFVVVNYRPVILGNNLAASFPSSTTMTVISIMGTAILLFKHLLKQKKRARRVCIIISGLIITITVIGRLISGVHWFSDILGGVLIGLFFVKLYHSLEKCIKHNDTD